MAFQEHKALTGDELHLAFGQTGSGNPNGVFTPNKINELYLDVTNTIAYAAVGLTNTDWNELDHEIFNNGTEGQIITFDSANDPTLLSPGPSGTVLTSNGATSEPSYQSVLGTGDVIGPASSTNNALARYNGITGKVIKDSSVLADDSGNITAGTYNGRDVATDGSKLDTIATNATNTPLSSTPPVNVTKSSSSAGVSSEASRQDHKHDVDTAIPVGIGSSNSEGSGTSLSRSDHVHDHGNLGNGSLHTVATTSINGFMSSADKTKLDGVPSAFSGELVVNPFSFTSNSKAPWASRSAGTNQTTNFSFEIPSDFSSVKRAVVRLIPDSSFVSVDIDLTLGFGGTGELFTANSNTDTTTTYSFTSDQISEIDISALFTSVSASDSVGFELDHNAIGGTIHYTALILEYNKT